MKVSGTKPDLRCGSSLQCYMSNCILFGGVTDNDVDGIGNTASAFLKSNKRPDTTRMRSAFYNDLYRFDLLKLQWYPIEFKSDKAAASADQGPSARMNASMVIKHGIVYLYGGLRELDERKQVRILPLNTSRLFLSVYLR